MSETRVKMGPRQLQAVRNVAGELEATKQRVRDLSEAYRGVVYTFLEAHGEDLDATFTWRVEGDEIVVEREERQGEQETLEGPHA